MPISRSSLEFLRRHNRRPTPRTSQHRFDVDGQQVNRLPLDRGQLEPSVLIAALGDPPPDRGVTDRWPPSQEVGHEPTA